MANGEKLTIAMTAPNALMADRRLIRAGLKVKILGDGELKGRLTIRAHAFSKNAREKITAAGGVAEVITQAAHA